MILTHLVLFNFRCHRRLELQLSSGLALLTGPNGSGKTSVLESIYVLARGISPRVSALKEAITLGERVLRVEGCLQGPDGTVRELGLGYDIEGHRRLSAGGLVLDDPSQVQDIFPVRMFLPEDLRLIKGAPRRRRDYLDRICVGDSPAFRRTLVSYEQALEQRNFLLRLGDIGDNHGPWESILAREGLAIARRRAQVLASLAPGFTRIYSALAGPSRGVATVVYRTNLAEMDESGYRERLVAHRAADRQRTFTHLGPHRDDLRFMLQGRDLRSLGSRGEQRLALLALFLAERQWLLDMTGLPSLLLLDDVLGELDMERRRSLLRLLVGSAQVLITATDVEQVPSDLRSMMEVLRLPERGKDRGGT